MKNGFFLLIMLFAFVVAAINLDAKRHRTDDQWQNTADYAAAPPPATGTQTIDYDALAKKYGAISSQPPPGAGDAFDRDAQRRREVDELVKVAGVMNGRTWRFIDRGWKIGYVTGVWEGGAAFASDGRIPQLYDCESCTPANVVDGVDEIYKRPENLDLPVLFAYGIFVEKVKGVPPDSIAFMLAYGRKRFFPGRAE